MRIYRHNIDSDYLVKEHAAGRTVADLAREFGVTHKVIKARLEKHGIVTRSSNALNLPELDIIAMYESGESELATSKRFGISRNVVRRLLHKHNKHVRTQSEAESLKWSKMDETQRAAQVEAAHKATKGVKLSFEHLCKRAATKERLGRFDSGLEKQVFEMLISRGIFPKLQKAIGPYNCDIVIGNISVEVWGGGWHFMGKHAARTPDRIRYLFDAGYHVIVVCNIGGHGFTEETGDCIMRFIEFASRQPPDIRQYRVIRGAGELLAACSSNDNTIPIKPTFGGSLDF